MKNYKVKLRYTIEHEVEVVVSATSAVAAMNDATSLYNIKEFKESYISPIAIHSISEMKEDV
jgi:hypothetical protein